MSNRFSRCRYAAPVLISAMLVFGGAATAWAQPRVKFDIPDTIECHNVTPDKCAAAHPLLMVIEGKFRVSARITKGSEADIVDFLYMLVSSNLHLKIHDYLPNTTLESALAEDHIEVAETTENSSTTGEDAHVNYKIFSIGGSKNQNSKVTEANHYKQIVPKALVLASGTTNREHGVFFKLRPSNAASLEGAKEFTFLAIVPKTWRGDWCTVACAARGKKKSLLPTSIVLAGIEQAHIGLYLSGDHEASVLADELFAIQEKNEVYLSRELAKESGVLLESMQEATNHPFGSPDAWLHVVFKHKSDSVDGERAKATMLDTQDRLSKLSGATP